MQPNFNISRMVSVQIQSLLMDVQEIRRANLRRIIDSKFDGVAGRLADAVRKPRPNIGQILSADRSFGERVARDIEKALGLKPMSLDAPGDLEILTEEAASIARTYMALSPNGQAKVRYYLEVALEMERIDAAGAKFSLKRAEQ